MIAKHDSESIIFHAESAAWTNHSDPMSVFIVQSLRIQLYW